ncbi:MAG: NHLP family bacteriocin export ABC transporter peptidase/permease/ATPase subunit [Firmicutes bacterium]|nr:NHLP family bacteriocin export ABC transporter peptidase/permease/ATPase subunit [Bacillota bacterium]
MKNVKKPVVKGVAKTPVVMQLEALECGAACLAMVLAYYDKYLPLEKIRSDCGVSRNGSNAKNIILTAQAYGLNAAGFKTEPSILRNEGEFPCIVHWNFNHFVVCNGFKGNKVYLNDPAKGSIVISYEEFDKCFTGVCILFEPTENFKPSGKRKTTFSLVRENLKGNIAPLAFVFALTAVTTLLTVADAGFLRFFSDRLLNGHNDRYLLPFTLALGILYLANIISQILRNICSLRLRGKIAVTGSAKFMWHIFKLPMEFFSQRSFGDILLYSKINANLAANLINIVAPMLINIVMLFFYLFVMLRYSLTLTVIGIACVAVNIAVSRYIAGKRLNTTRVLMRDKGELASASLSGIEMIQAIKASGSENAYFQRWSGLQARVNNKEKDFQIQSIYYSALPQLLSQLANTAVLLIGVYLVMRGKFTLGMILVFESCLANFTSPANQTITSAQNFTQMRTDTEKINDIMNYREDPFFSIPERSETEESEKLSGNIEIKNITFGYDPHEKPLIENFSLNVKKGSRIAIVGGSGSGKSTLSRLISGLYKPSKGEILFDGKNINAIERSLFTGSVAVVNQDITLFSDTIANNIRMWDDSIEDFEVILAARDACLHDEVMKKPGGYNYRLCENGSDLSGGEKQRVEIARVLAQDPTIVILDEATGALDAITEHKVVNAIKERGLTCIIITHRLSAIRDCDQIIVLENGKIAEMGTHEELFAKKGIYTKLISNE